MKKRLIILGSGPAGLTAAIYASRAQIDTTIISGVDAGGQLMITTEVDDFPGFPQGIQGPDLIHKMKEQAEKFGAKFTEGGVTKVDFSKKPFLLWVGEEKISTDSVILATGASAKWLGIPSEKKLIGRGVSACATCDAPFFKDKVIGVVGGGDASMRESLYLSKFASQVLVIHRREELRAFPILQEKAKSNPKIKFLFNKVVDEVLGEGRVEGVKLKDTKTGEISKVALSGLFIAIGHEPNTGFLKGQIKLNEKGYIVVADETKTSVDGVFAAGDVSDWKYRQAVTAAGSGCKAALDVQDYLENV